MSETNTAVVETPAAPKAAKAPKAPAKKDGLRKPQVRILAALAKAKGPLTRKEIAAKAPVDLAFCTEYVGSNDEAKRLANDVKHWPSLLTLKLVKFAASEEGTAYEITALGVKTLAKIDS